jgi:hypothetical protein
MTGLLEGIAQKFGDVVLREPSGQVYFG